MSGSSKNKGNTKNPKPMDAPLKTYNTRRSGGCTNNQSNGMQQNMQPTSGPSNGILQYTYAGAVKKQVTQKPMPGTAAADPQTVSAPPHPSAPAAVPQRPAVPILTQARPTVSTLVQPRAAAPTMMQPRPAAPTLMQPRPTAPLVQQRPIAPLMQQGPIVPLHPQRPHVFIPQRVATPAQEPLQVHALEQNQQQAYVPALGQQQLIDVPHQLAQQQITTLAQVPLQPGTLPQAAPLQAPPPTFGFAPAALQLQTPPENVAPVFGLQQPQQGVEAFPLHQGYAPTQNYPQVHEVALVVPQNQAQTAEAEWTQQQDATRVPTDPMQYATQNEPAEQRGPNKILKKGKKKGSVKNIAKAVERHFANRRMAMTASMPNQMPLMHPYTYQMPPMYFYSGAMGMGYNPMGMGYNPMGIGHPMGNHMRSPYPMGGGMMGYGYY